MSDSQKSRTTHIDISNLSVMRENVTYYNQRNYVHNKWILDDLFLLNLN